MDFICPFCGATFRFYDDSLTMEDIEGCTTDCPKCNTTLLVENGIFVDALETFAKEISEHVGHSVKKEDIHYIA